MNVLALGTAVLLSILFALGWVLLLSMPLAVLSAATVGGVLEGAASAARSSSALARNALRGILCLEGLASAPASAERLRADLARVLRLAAPGTRPRACACVKESGGAFVGVLRIFNTKGHYLLRASGASPGAVAARFTATLEGFRDAFPAREGARRVRCPECDPGTCPLRRRAREQALAPA